MDWDAMSIVFACVTLTSTFGLVLSICLIVINIKYRSDRLVKMSSPTLNIIMLIGAILLYVSNVVHGMTSYVAINCRLWVWLLAVAFSLLYGCLFVKSWRVNRIFTNPHQTKTVIKDYQLVLMVTVLVTVDLVVLTVWEVMEHLRPGQEAVEIAANATSHLQPVTEMSSRYTAIFTTIFLLYKSLYLMYGAYLSWAIRQVTIPPMDDSSCILISGHVTAVSACLAIAAWSVLKEVEAAVYGSAAASVWLATTVTVMVEFVPKIHYWFKHQNDEFLKMTLSPYVQQTPSPLSPNVPKPDMDKTYEYGAKTAQLTEVVTTQVPNVPDVQETPTRQVPEIKRDSPDSGHDSPQSVATPNGLFTMYQIENEIQYPHLHKSCSEGSTFASSDVYDVTVDSHAIRKRMYYDYLRRNRGLATRITQTYDLDSDSDTMTYISRCLSPSQSMASVVSKSSKVPKEAWTLDSDNLYPSSQTSRDGKRVKRKSRSQRQNSRAHCHTVGRGSSASVI